MPAPQLHGPSRLRRLYSARARSRRRRRASHRLQFGLCRPFATHAAASGIEDTVASAPELHERPFDDAVRPRGRRHDGVQGIRALRVKLTVNVDGSDLLPLKFFSDKLHEVLDLCLSEFAFER